MSLRQFVTNPYMDEIYSSFRKNYSDTEYYQILEETIRQNFNVSAIEMLNLECGVGLSIHAKFDRKHHAQIKIIKGMNSILHQTECCNIQNYLRKQQFPCTTPIGAPCSFLGNSLQIEEYNIGGEYKDSHDNRIMSLQVEKLVNLHDLLSRYDSSNLSNIALKTIPRDMVWLNPPQSVFSFDKITTGDDDIKKEAILAKSIFEQDDNRKIILSHEDWSNKHFRFNGESISVIYDWDSIARIDELYSIGLACSTFTATWYYPTEIFPTQKESLQFVETYESVIGEKFTKEEKRIISAYAAYTLAYIARCAFAQNNGSIKGTDIEIPFSNINKGLYF